MQNGKTNTPVPVSVTDQYLHGMVLRLDALCDMVNSLITYIAEKEGIATENNKVVERPAPPSRKKK